jgi:hypothetical protein
LERELLLEIQFHIDHGFRFSYPKLEVEHADTDYQRGLQVVQSILYDRIVETVNGNADAEKLSKWQIVVKELINNPDSLRTD